MRKFLTFVMMAAAVVGIVWYENQPETVAIPVETEAYAIGFEEPYIQEVAEEETTTTVVAETTEVVAEEVNFDVPDVTMIVEGTAGDDVRVREVMSEAMKIEDLPSAVQTAIRGCTGVTDRSMVVQVDALVELTSALPATIDVDYGTIGHAALFDYSSGLSCDDGHVKHELDGNDSSHFTYWVALSGAITPDFPDGDVLNKSWSLSGINVTLPGLETYYWKEWGRRVYRCRGLGGYVAKIWIAGKPGAETNQGCRSAEFEHTALGNMK